ncbi:MT-A70 family protein [Oxytricha trifallax]|uniref:MT-A70 family protein n=1 Tax=Oxytricha trifallax TaxID=1172189 RepID=A0A073IBA4_9SPIT|nr:MT-A70 family protein [Oxytricha trifallax]
MLLKGNRQDNINLQTQSRVVDAVVWVKQGVHKKYKNRMGYHLRYSKEICLVELNGAVPTDVQPYKTQDIIQSVSGKNSEKLKEIKRIMKSLIQQGYCYDLFARDENACEKFVSIGNELHI